MRNSLSYYISVSSVGFEQLINQLSEFEKSSSSKPASGYPPYNILKKPPNLYVIEFAVAGFSNKDIEVTVESNKLNIVGKVSAQFDGEFLHRGISSRDFIHTFTLAENILVRGATLVNGLLSIEMEKRFTRDEGGRKISISTQN